MAISVKFFVEDRTMQKFIIDYAEKHFGKTLDPNDFVRFGSWSGISAEYKTFKENTDKGGINLLFVDADNDFANRMKYLNGVIKRGKINCEVFLFPDHANSGNMETLLDTIATNNEAKECYKQYEKCLKSKRLALPSLKTKVYTYTEVLTTEANRKKNLHKDPNRDYLNSNWNLKHKVLKPLYTFLKKHPL